MKMDQIIDGIMCGVLAAIGGICIACAVYLVLIMNGTIV